ncbi:MAG TPA: hypothetical protein VHN99_10095, partial [Deinococcales bacterium]|nr:hypothetical protein [Deinococcales bacterium]
MRALVATAAAALLGLGTATLVLARGAGPVPPAFHPPADTSIPPGPFGDLVRLGQALFLDTRARAPGYVGNGLKCVNCHLDAGRLARSAPMWGAWVRYPAYRAKTGEVDT